MRRRPPAVPSRAKPAFSRTRWDGDVFGSDNGLQSLKVYEGWSERDFDHQTQCSGGDTASAKRLADGVTDRTDPVIAAGDVKGNPAGGMIVGKNHPLHLAVKIQVERHG